MAWPNAESREPLSQQQESVITAVGFQQTAVGRRRGAIAGDGDSLIGRHVTAFPLAATVREDDFDVAFVDRSETEPLARPRTRSAGCSSSVNLPRTLRNN